MSSTPRRFVQIADAIREPNAWTNNEWLIRPDIVEAEKLLLVRANMDPMFCHPFHYHPHREEIIHVVYGRAEQWVGNEYRILSAGESAPGTRTTRPARTSPSLVESTTPLRPTGADSMPSTAVRNASAAPAATAAATQAWVEVSASALPSASQSAPPTSWPDK